ncbi:MAG: hypothetical protein COA53_01565 [Rhodobacteraceae bacterium]|nr:MAG: hypothetical protein COA53_01565 [Paracoccaceae bacterium]
MHEFNLIIIMSIASSVGWTAAIYDDDLPLSIGYFVASLVGAFMASYMALWFLPQYGNVGVVLAALIGAISLTAVLRIFRKKKS